MVDGYTLARKEVIFLESTVVLYIDNSLVAICMALFLIAELAGCTERSSFESARCCMESLEFFGDAKYTRSHDELDLLESKVTKTLVPSNEFLFWLG